MDVVDFIYIFIIFLSKKLGQINSFEVAWNVVYNEEKTDQDFEMSKPVDWDLFLQSVLWVGHHIIRCYIVENKHWISAWLFIDKFLTALSQHNIKTLYQLTLGYLYNEQVFLATFRFKFRIRNRGDMNSATNGIGVNLIICS